MVIKPTEEDLEGLGLLLHDLKSLEHLELGGDRDGVLRWLCRKMAKGMISLRIRNLTVRCGEHARRRALRLQHLADAAGIITTITWIPCLRVREEPEVDTDAEVRMTS